MPDSDRVEHTAGAVETPAHVALRRAKRQALALLLVVTAVFVATSLATKRRPPGSAGEAVEV